MSATIIDGQALAGRIKLDTAVAVRELASQGVGVHLAAVYADLPQPQLFAAWGDAVDIASGLLALLHA